MGTPTVDRMWIPPPPSPPTLNTPVIIDPHPIHTHVTREISRNEPHARRRISRTSHAHPAYIPFIYHAQLTRIPRTSPRTSRVRSKSDLHATGLESREREHHRAVPRSSAKSGVQSASQGGRAFFLNPRTRLSALSKLIWINEFDRRGLNADNRDNPGAVSGVDCG